MYTRFSIDKAGLVGFPSRCGKSCIWNPATPWIWRRRRTNHTPPGRGTGPLAKEHGVWVFRTGQPLPASATDDMLRQIREERDLANLGKGA